MPHASKLARQMCSTANLEYRPGQSSRPAGEQTGQNVLIQYLRKNTIA